ncbi:MAG: hypothetical protein ABR509_08710 [Candidatus Limnocylindria bacterium]
MLITSLRDHSEMRPACACGFLPRTARMLGAAWLMMAGVVASLPAPASAADPITIEARGLVGGHFEPGGWLAVDVSITNSGPPVDAYVTAQSETGPVSRLVELPSGARKSVPLYVRPQAFARQLRVRLVSTAGDDLAETRVEIRTASDGNVAVVGDATGNLRAQLSPDEPGGGDRVLQITTVDIPERPEPLVWLDAMVWAADSGALSDAQRRALERWVAGGGHLTVLGGADWQARAAAFEPLLPLSGIGAVDGLSVTPLGEWAGDPLPDGVTPTVSTGELRDGADLLVPLGSDDTRPLVSAQSVGAGTLVFIGADLGSDDFATWDGAGRLWNRLIPDTRIAAQFFGAPPVEQQSFAFIGALGSIAALSVPPAELLLLVIVGYIVIIGPVSYVVLRRLDRRELAWVTAPLLVVFFSASSYGIGSATKGGDIILNEIAVIRTAGGGTAATVESYAGVFSPNRASYDLRVGGDALIAALGTGNQFDPQTGAPITPTASVEQGDPAWLRDLEVNVFGLQAVRADAIVPYRPSLEVSWHYTEDGIEGEVRNAGEGPVEDVAVINGNAEVVGDLDAGQSADFAVDAPRGFQEEPISQQIYGFDDFSSGANTEERLRRQVLDGLVGQGFGPFFAMGAPVPASWGGSGSGPLVIGWREAENPVAFEVDGKTVERHTHLVEVLSGRPEYRSGPVRLEPGALSTAVVGHDGDAVAELGGATLGSGSVDFRIALPLEVAELEPREIEVIVGSDPGMVLAGDQFGGGAGFPAGYRLSVRDVTTESWVDLGAAGQQLTFDLDEPARFVDGTGQMFLRIARDPAAATAGDRMSVFVGARVRGVLP